MALWLAYECDDCHKAKWKWWIGSKMFSLGTGPSCLLCVWIVVISTVEALCPIYIPWCSLIGLIFLQSFMSVTCQSLTLLFCVASLQDGPKYSY